MIGIQLHMIFCVLVLICGVLGATRQESDNESGWVGAGFGVCLADVAMTAVHWFSGGF